MPERAGKRELEGGVLQGRPPGDDAAVSAEQKSDPLNGDRFTSSGAGDGTRTREYELGKLGPYHLATPAKCRS